MSQIVNLPGAPTRKRTVVKAWLKSNKKRRMAGALSLLAQVSSENPTNPSELKNKDVTTLGITAFGLGTGTLTLLNGIAPGTSEITRLGRKITMKSHLMRVNISVAPTTTGTTNLRLIVFYDRQANAAAPAATQVLTTDDISSGMNLGNAKRFVVIHDAYKECLSPTGGPTTITWNLYKKFNLPVQFNAGVAGTVADIQTGSVYALLYHNGLITVATPLVQSFSRIRFNDS